MTSSGNGKDKSLALKDVTPNTHNYHKEAVLQKCHFLKEIHKNGIDSSDKKFNAWLSIVIHFEEPWIYIHEIMTKHGTYNKFKTDEIIQGALEVSPAPYTVKQIEALGFDCGPNCTGNSLVTPLTLKNDLTIATLNSGFRQVRLIDGTLAYGKPEYGDLAAHADQDFGYFTVEDNAATYKYLPKKNHWALWHNTGISGFIEDNLYPKPTNMHVKEFTGKIKRTNIRFLDEIEDKVAGYLNVKNGVLDIKTGEVFPHSKEWAFMYRLDYDYDKDAKAPMFEKFLKEITLDRQELIDILLEFVAYGLSNDRLWVHKALFLYGESGANGKSTFLKIIQALIGDDNYSSVSISDLGDPQQVALLQGKLFNIKAESGKALYDCEEFKEVTSGESLNAKVVYQKPYKIKPRAKFMVACNSLPKSCDTSGGFFRRILIIPFDAYFGESNASTIAELDKIIIEKEASGIINLLVEAYKRLHKQGGFTKSEISVKLVKEYQTDNMPELDFFEDTYEFKDIDNKAFKIAYSSIYTSYTLWCTSNGIAPRKVMAKRPLFKMLESKIDGLRIRKGRWFGSQGYLGLLDTTIDIDYGMR